MVRGQLRRLPGRRLSVEEVRAVGDRVLAVARIAGRTHDDPTRLEVRLALLYAMRGGRIAHVQVFLSPERALAAAGAPGADGDRSRPANPG